MRGSLDVDALRVPEETITPADVDKVLVRDGSDDRWKLATVSTLSSASTAGVAAFNGRSGTVSPQSGDYTADQVTETASRVFSSPAAVTKLAGIETGAQVNAQQISGAEVADPLETAPRSFSPADLAAFIAIHGVPLVVADGGDAFTTEWTDEIDGGDAFA